MADDYISENLELVLSQIREAEKKSGRDDGSVKLCAVSKFHPVESLLAAYEAGQLLFGENRVQEASEKFGQLKNLLEPKGASMPYLHIIGSLQSNKVKKALEYACVIQSVDRPALLQEIEKQCARMDRTVEVYFELHTGEDSKAGFPDTDSLLSVAEDCAKGLYPHVVPSGVMTMAPFVDDERVIRKSFSQLRFCREDLNRRFPELPINELSMGMSGDFRIAIEEGSTMVRIGTAIFGQRVY